MNQQFPHGPGPVRYSHVQSGARRWFSVQRLSRRLFPENFVFFVGGLRLGLPSGPVAQLRPIAGCLELQAGHWRDFGLLRMRVLHRGLSSCAVLRGFTLLASGSCSPGRNCTLIAYAFRPDIWGGMG